MPDLTKVDELFDDGTQVSLAWSSSDARVNSLLRCAVGVFEYFYPERVHGYYLVGSYADGSAVSASDIDLHPVFKGELTSAEQQTVYAVRDRCNAIPRVDLNVDPWPEHFAHRVYSGLFSLVSVLVYGTDIRPSIRPPPVDEFVRDAIGVGGLLKIRGARQLRYPLRAPDESDEFLGYASRPAYSFEDESAQGTKDLVNVAYTIVRGRLATQRHEYITSKSQAFQTFIESADDQWVDVIDEIWRRGRSEWEYFIPNKDRDREILRRICSRIPDLENEYLRYYRDYLVSQLKTLEPEQSTGEVDAKVTALQSLGVVTFPTDQEVRAILETYHGCDVAQWRQAAEVSIER